MYIIGQNAFALLRLEIEEAVVEFHTAIVSLGCSCLSANMTEFWFQQYVSNHNIMRKDVNGDAVQIRLPLTVTDPRAIMTIMDRERTKLKSTALLTQQYVIYVLL